MTYTIEEKFQQFLGSSGLHSEPAQVIEKMRMAYLHAAEPSPPELPKFSDNMPPGQIGCNRALRLIGKPYPRTCTICGLGPCLKGQSC